VSHTYAVFASTEVLIDRSVEFPEDKVGVLQTNDHIHVEQDGEVKTQ
jgi:hypothetical protein